MKEIVEEKMQTLLDEKNIDNRIQVAENAIKSPNIEQVKIEKSSEENKAFNEKSNAENKVLKEESSAENNALKEKSSAENKVLKEESSAENKALKEESSAENKALKEESSAENNALKEEENIDVDKLLNCDVNKDNNVKGEDEPKRIFEKKNWQEKVRTFFEEYPTAANFAEKIGQTILVDNSLENDENCLQKAYLKVLSGQYVAPAQIIDDQNFREQFVFNNEEIKSIIIEKYLEELEVKKPPKTITARGQILLTPSSMPKNIEDAGKVINMMFKNRRI